MMRHDAGGIPAYKRVGKRAHSTHVTSPVPCMPLCLRPVVAKASKEECGVKSVPVCIEARQDDRQMMYRRNMMDESGMYLSESPRCTHHLVSHR